MLRLAIVDPNGKIVELKDVPSAAELLALAHAPGTAVSSHHGEARDV